LNSIGKCKCGEIEYAVSGDVIQIVNCHCNMCREMNGSAFSTYLVVPSQNLSFVQGESGIAKYTVTDRTAKHFCKNCGTAIFNSNPSTYPGLTMLYLGTHKNFSGLTPGINIYCESKLAWVDGIMEIKSIDGGPRATA
jgi:hypothetical protein